MVLLNISHYENSPKLEHNNMAKETPIAAVLSHNVMLTHYTTRPICHSPYVLVIKVCYDAMGSIHTTQL